MLGRVRAALGWGKQERPQSSPESPSWGPEDGPAQVGRYRLLEILGSGGTATVFRAQREDEPEVALKLLKPSLSGDLRLRERFRREFRVARDLSHPALVRTLAFREDEPWVYLVLELVQGIPLDGLIPPEGLPLEPALRLLRPVLSGLGYAHERGLVHRDLKPRNLMADPQGAWVKIMDFGLARDAEVQRVTGTGQAVGTPAYIAPEQLVGAFPDPLADQYSLGIVLYQLLTGRRPFEDPDPQRLLLCHLEQEPPPPTSFRPDLAPAVEAVILRMLSKVPRARYPDLTAVQRAVEEAVEQPEAVPLPLPQVTLGEDEETGVF